MIHDVRPAVMNAIRSGINRRGALTALLAALPFAPLGVEHASATRNQRHGTRSAKSERKRKKKARAGPAGPQGTQGPAGAPGSTGPKAITSALLEREHTCQVAGNTLSSPCSVDCNPGEIAVSGGFEAQGAGIPVFESARTQPPGWKVRVQNLSGQELDVTVLVYCLPT